MRSFRYAPFNMQNSLVHLTPEQSISVQDLIPIRFMKKLLGGEVETSKTKLKQERD